MRKSQTAAICRMIPTTDTFCGRISVAKAACAVARTRDFQSAKGVKLSYPSGVTTMVCSN